MALGQDHWDPMAWRNGRVLLHPQAAETPPKLTCVTNVIDDAYVANGRVVALDAHDVIGRRHDTTLSLTPNGFALASFGGLHLGQWILVL